jgi:putative ABC transport system substrate-binding protein
VKRRAFISLLGGAAAGPLAAGVQQAAMPVVGILASVLPGPYARFIEAIKQGLQEAGYVEGRNVAIEYRWAEGRSERFAEIVAEFVRLKVDVIVTSGTPVVLRPSRRPRSYRSYVTVRVLPEAQKIATIA